MFSPENYLILLIACIALQPVAACVNPELSQRDYYAIGIVKNSDGEVVYEEHHKHKADTKGGITQVEYIDPNDKLIAEKTIDYDCRASAPNYILSMNQADDWVEQVQWQSNKLVVTQPGSKKELDADASQSLVIDAGFDNFVFENWQALNQGQEKEIDFLHVPGNSLFPLVIKMESGNSDVELSDDVVLFKIKPENKLFRLFFEPIYLAYNKNSKQLDYYSGPTNLRGEIQGLKKSKQIAIKYRYN